MGDSVDTMEEKTLFWEDFTPGREWEAIQASPIEKEQIIAFATEFDPLEMHTDPERARFSPLGMHCASGVHTFGIAQRLMCEALLLQTKVVAGAKIDGFRLVAPVLPGDRLKLRAQVVRSLIHPGNHDRGWVVLKVDVATASRKTVLVYEVTVLILRRACKVDLNAGPP